MPPSQSLGRPLTGPRSGGRGARLRLCRDRPHTRARRTRPRPRGRTVCGSTPVTTASRAGAAPTFTHHGVCMTTGAFLASTDFKVADLSLADFGRKEIELAEHEMPGLMAHPRRVRRQPAARRRPHHRLAAHDDPDRGAHRDPRRPRRRRCGGRRCNIFSTQDHAAAAIASARRDPRRARPACRCSRGRARRSRSTGGAPSRRCAGPDGGGPNMILDDGGDATLLVHKGVEFEEAGEVPDPRPPTSRSTRSSSTLLRRSLGEDPRRWTDDRRGHQGRHRGDDHRRAPALPDARAGRRCSSRRSTSTTRSPSRSSTTSTAAGTR